MLKLSFCLLCSQLHSNKISFCTSCKKAVQESRLAFENGVRSLLWMSPGVSNFIVTMKMGVRPKESHWLGELLGQKYVESYHLCVTVPENSPIPEVCFPPSSKNLGYADHAELLAQGVAKTLEAPPQQDCLGIPKPNPNKAKKRKKDMIDANLAFD